MAIQKPLKNFYPYHKSISRLCKEEREKHILTSLLSHLTLYMWIFGHEQQTPSQCPCCSVSTGSEQVGHCVYQVRFIEVRVRDRRFLRGRTTTYYKIDMWNIVVDAGAEKHKRSKVLPLLSAAESKNSPRVLCTC